MEEKHIGAGCGVLVFNPEGKLLLGLRNYDTNIADSEMHEEGTWSCPGGNIEYGETFEEAGIREAKEETGIDIKDPEIFCVQTDLNEHAHYISVGMVAHSFEGIPRVMEPDELMAWKWFDLNDLPENIFSASKKTIDCYLQKKFYIK